MLSWPVLYFGGRATDHRGSLTFVNGLDMSGVKRFYKVNNSSTSLVRAWHGHMLEAKYAYVSKGKLFMAFVKLTDPLKPSTKELVNTAILSADKPAVLYIPPAYAHGFRALEKDTEVIFFSTLSLEESLQDDYRFDPPYWGKNVWKEAE